MVNSLRTKTRPVLWACLAVLGSQVVAYGQGTLYTEGPGVNPPFEEIRDDITPSGYAGPFTTIDVNNALVEGGIYGEFGIQDNLKIHTLGNSVVGENSFGNWSRWYQEDGATQIFRLFPGEENVRNDRPLAARIEAFDTNTGWNVDDGEWHDWVGRYTIVNPINAAIFQVKDVDGDAWSMQLNMESSGKVKVQHRTPLPGQPKFTTLIDNAIGQPFDIRIRDNGLDYEVYLNDQAQPFTAGQYVRNDEPGDTSKTGFRWGIYVGAKEVESEAMIFVSHATVDPDIDFPAEPPVVPGTLIAGWDTWDGSGVHAPNVTDGVTMGTTAKSGFSLDADRRASTDGTWGTLGTPAADMTADDNSDTVRLTNGSSGYYDFTVTDTGGLARDLATFHFDAATYRPASSRNYELSVLSGDLTVGSVATGIVPSVAGGQQDWSDFDIPLTGLADRTLDANGTVTFRLEFTGGTPGAGGHHQSLDNVAITAEAPVLPTTLIAGWETWSEVSADTWDATQATGVVAQAVGTVEAGGVWFNFNNATVENGASSDGQYGDSGPDGADTSVALATDGVTLSNGFDGFIDFTLTDTTGSATTLTGFHLDIGAFRAGAATDWELEVLAGGDLTAGSLATGAATVRAGPIADDESIDLTVLADHILDANGSVTFRLSFTGGGGEAGSPASGHHLFLDNVGVTGLSPGLTGDFDGDGDVDGSDFLQWQRNDGTTAGLAAWQANFGAPALQAATESASHAVPEPTTSLLMLFAAPLAWRRR